MPFESTYTDRDVNMVITPSDFPGNERLAATLIEEMREEYRDDAMIACMTFHRGVLGSEAKILTREDVDRSLGLIN